MRHRKCVMLRDESTQFETRTEQPCSLLPVVCLEAVGCLARNVIRNYAA